MRLLQQNNDGDFSLTEFFESGIPKYAILSHRWGPEEVTFKDLMDSTSKSKSKAGYGKIQFCGRQAKHDGLQYFWVDTCCIDKSNSTELAEAINSMFRWYQDAAKCYVYLPDVSRPHSDSADKSNELWESTFRKSAWFTRSWTLQELIAPASVDFFSKEGELLGNKASLERHICEITGIPVNALRGSPLSDFSVAERMSWAASRETYRPEDKAYSLLGVFNVNMSLIYGEGGEAAVKRLRNKIEKASKGTKRENFSVPFSLSNVVDVEHFVARKAELAQIHASLSGDGSRRTVVLHGLGGIGKTQLSAAYAERHKESYSALFWLNIKDEDALKQSFARIARQILRAHPSTICLSNIDTDENLDEVVDAVKAWLSLPDNTRWLMIYDNYDNPSLLGNTDPRAINIQQFLPESYQGSVIITTRSSQVRIGRSIRIHKLEDMRDSLEILSSVSRRGNLITNPDAIKLAKELDGLPLALATAGAYLDQVTISFSGYLSLYKESWLQLQMTSPELSSYEDRTLYSTWQISFNHAKQQNELSAKLLCFWAYFDNQDLWVELLQHGDSTDPDWVRQVAKDEVTFHNAMRVLSNHGLVEIDMSVQDLIESRGYSIHRCVHSWAVYVLNQTWDYDLARLAVQCVGSHVPAEKAVRPWLTQRRLLQHATRCSYIVLNGLVADEGIELACNNLGNLYRTQGKLAQAEQMYQRALQGYEKAWGPEHTSTLDTVNNLGLLYADQGKLVEAEQLYQRALQGKEKAWGPEHTSTLDTVNNLGILYRTQGRLVEAVELLEHVVKILKITLAEDHPRRLASQHDLAGTYQANGQVKEAMVLLEQVVNICETTLAEDHPDRLASQHALALAYVANGQEKEAVALLEQVVKIRETTLAEDHPDRLASQHDLAGAYQANGQVKEAAALLEQQVKIQEYRTNAYVGADMDAKYASKPVTRPWNNLDRRPAKTPYGSELVPQSGHDLDRTPLEATADSAYASRTHNSLDTETTPGVDVETITEDIEYTLVDSAFAESQSPGDKLEMEAENLGLYSAGTIYSASVTPSLPTLRDENYVTDLAAELFSTIQHYEVDKEALEHIVRILPGLLRAFALKIGHRAREQMHRDVSFFVHKYRERVRACFEERFSFDDSASEEPSPNDDRVQLSQDAVGRYFNSLDETHTMEQHTTVTFGDELAAALAPCHSHETPTEKNEDGVEDEDEFEDDMLGDSIDTLKADTSVYRDFIVGTPAYSWLIATLQREATLKRATPDLMEDIRNNIFAALPSKRKVSRKSPSPEYKATFCLEWDPLSFVKEQRYTESPGVALERAITLTGSVNDAQAVTTREYLSQTWPATGIQVMRLVTDVAGNEIGHHITTELPDGTELDAHMLDQKFLVIATGTSDSIAEVGEQLAWLGAALRSSPSGSGVTTCSPLIQSTHLIEDKPLAETSGSKILAQILCTIWFEMKPQAKSAEVSNGQCWQKMFKNPVMVSGYPILAKHEQGLGLEMPLNIIAGLAGSDRATIFDGKVFIKGFSTMLIAIKITRGLVLWHYFYNDDGERLAYLDHSVQAVDDISLLQLDTARNIVGWCTDCMYYTGAADARFDIEGTGLPRPHAGCLLEKVSISAGKIITGGVTFAVSVKDIPPHLTRNGYIPKLKWMATKYVVLWDEADKRGWLVNGTSALLHLVRTSLEHYSNDDFASAFLFDPNKMNDASDHKPNSAPNVLIDGENREIEIYPGKSERSEEEEEKQTANKKEELKSKKKKRGYYLFEDLVEQHYNTLEQIMEYHSHVVGQNGVNLKARMRKHLEGWDFIELATDHDPRPRVTTLNAVGYGWVDFIRSIDAVALFGRGFGDLIWPKEFEGMCPRWRSLPTHKYYLAASMFDLNRIIKKFGDERASPMRPVQDLLWHCPGELVSKCQCQGQGGRQMMRNLLSRHHDPVQVFCPQKLHHAMHIQGPGRLEDRGAVVFGHNVSWNFRWRNNGNEDLEEGDPRTQTLVPNPHYLPNRSESSSGPSNQTSRLPIASGSSESHGSTADVMPRSSTSATSVQSTPVESIVDSAHSSAPTEPNLAYNPPVPDQQMPPNENRSRTLRHEKRRLGR